MNTNIFIGYLKISNNLKSTEKEIEKLRGIRKDAANSMYESSHDHTDTLKELDSIDLSLKQENDILDKNQKV